MRRRACEGVRNAILFKATAEWAARRGVGAAMAAAGRLLRAMAVGGGTFSETTNVPERRWSAQRLSAPRKYVSAVGHKSKAFFAGGQGPDGAADVVDIWDSVDGNWDHGKLSQPRMWLAGAALRNLVAFGGGLVSRKRDGAYTPTPTPPASPAHSGTPLASPPCIQPVGRSESDVQI